MGDVVPFRRKTKAECGVAYQYPIGNRETLTVLFHALYGWTGRLTFGNGRSINLNRWASSQAQVVAGLFNLYQLG
jgi:hypothetical protein